MNNERVSDLLYEALQTEQDGARIYETAIRCAVNDDLKEEWARSLSETREHEQTLLEVFDAFGLDAEAGTAGRDAARHVGRSLVQALDRVLAGGPSAQAQLVACECVLHAETKGHLNWELLGEVAGKLKGEVAGALARVHARIDAEEAAHLHHARGWTRELWLEYLGVPAVLPPPERRRDVEDAVTRARAKATRGEPL